MTAAPSLIHAETLSGASQGRIRPTVRRGEFHLHEQFRSRHLPGPRKILVYTPPGYAAQKLRRFPVLYMHDGQNLFDRPDSEGSVTRWCCDESLDALIAEGRSEPVIIVAIWNAGRERIDEYAPAHDERLGAGGKLLLHGEMLVREIKPFIDSHYRTLRNPANNGVGGSSLGALASLYLGLRHPDVFGKVVAISPSVWWGGRSIVRFVQALERKPPVRIWLSAGSAEGGSVIPDARRLRGALLKKGWRQGVDFQYLEAREGRHNEVSWGEVLQHALESLFSPTEGIDLGGLERL